MNKPRRAPYPAVASAWMVGEESRRVLDLGSAHGAFASMLAGDRHHVFCLDRSEARIRATAERVGTGRSVVAQAEALPFADCQFDVVTASQSLHRFAPGLALAEIARVLRPEGHIAIAYNTRDDTVPWVKKLTRLVQASDPEAMTGDYGVSVIDQVEDSVYFRLLERKNFRNWVPIDRAGLLSMVERRAATTRLDASRKDRLLSEVGALYDEYARAPEPLLLPYQASCWRAKVDHRELRLNDRSDEALQIPLGF